MSSNYQFYLVGGAVRDLVFGCYEPSDFDYVVMVSSFQELVHAAKQEGFLPVPNSNSESGFVEERHHLGIKALCPVLNKVVDIHCARSEFNYSDGAHPDEVKIGTLVEDAQRRDFRINSLLLPRGCYDLSQILDINGGLYDIEMDLLCSVGPAYDRFIENPDRVIRAFRFAIKYGLALSCDICQALENPNVIERVRKENDDRKFKSLNKILKVKSFYLQFFSQMQRFPEMSEAIFSNIGLEATNKKVFQ